MSAYTDRKLRERAAVLGVRHLSGRTYEVDSGSGGRPHIVRGAVDQEIGTWTCDCIGSGGRRHWCSHKQALSRELGCEVVEAPHSKATRSEPTMQQPPTPPPGKADNLATFEIYAPTRGNVRSEDADGEITLRLCVPSRDRAAIDAVLAALRAGGQGATVRLVPVLTQGGKA